MVTGRPLTVALLVNDLRMGGAERQLVELAKGLDKTRFRVLVVTLYSGGPLEDELRDRDDVTLISLERSGKYDFRTVLRLASLLRRQRVDVIQPFLTPATLFGLTAALLARTPIKIATERCGLRLNTHLGNRAYRFAEDRLTRFADAVVPNSEAGREYVLSRGIAPRKVRVIYNGVSPSRTDLAPGEREAAREALGVPPEGALAGIVASLQTAKDHETFLQAAAIVRRSLPDARFAIVGDGPLRAQLERRSRELGLDSCVSFAGQQLRVAPYIAAFDVAVLSSCDHEGCSNFLLEAMALGRPLVATDVGGNAELFTAGRAGFLVPPKEPGAMAAAVLDVLQNTETASRMSRESLDAFSGRFTLGGMVRAYEDLYLELWQRKSLARGGRPVAEPVRGPGTPGSEL